MERVQKIAFIESAAAMGGVQFSTLYLARTLDRTRWHPVVVCPGEGDLTNLCRQAGIETQVVAQHRMWSTSLRVGHRFRAPNPFAWMRNLVSMSLARRRLVQLLKKNAPDLVVTKGLPAHFIGGMAARKLRLPCVWHVQDLISERTLGIYRRVLGLAARWLPAQIIADGAAIKKQLPRSLGSRIAVVLNGVDTNAFRPGLDGSSVRAELGISNTDLVIGHAGRITPWKGQHHLVEAFARIASKYPTTNLLFVGSPVFDHDAYERRLRAMATELGLEKRVRFAGYRHDLANVLAAMDIFAFTSIEKDTSPLALLSAMSSGLPIAAFDIEGVRELVDNDNQVLRTPVGDVGGLAAKLEALIADKYLRLQMGQAARRLAEKKFSQEQYARSVERVLLSAQSGSVDSTTEVTGQFTEQNSVKLSASTS